MTNYLLVIDDSEIIRKQVSGLLLEAGLFANCLTASNGMEGFKYLTASPADLVICDLDMPYLDGLKFLRLVNAQPQLRGIPIVVLTANHDRRLKLDGLALGACDYLTKPFDPEELVARVSNHLGMKKFRDELRRAKDHYQQLSNTDPLTNLYNRRFAGEILEAELQRARRLNCELSLLMVDIDHFKRVNDRYGHQAGDRVLVAVTEGLRSALRSYDVASRYGGEEFLIILPGTCPVAALEVADRLRESVAFLRFPPPMERLRVTVSIGVTSFPVAEHDDSCALFQRADDALFLAKANGRDRVEQLREAPPIRCSG
ncbi:diguanylate cyclase [Geomonas sp.]|uniref:diguanylate cyclase n=1 Tax=Geomonas sp. TaxID=2651584 RepID=UPI002B499CBD|nr:diguanylate cyclase [Geomonas sp.]HJV34007.1 diguanylate cyclase [Geomonas sp.]